MAPRFERPSPGAGPLVRAFRDGLFVVEEAAHRAVFLTPENALSWEDPPAPAEIGMADLAPALAIAPPPEFLILGTGDRMVFPPRPLVAALEERGIGLEAMDSRAAARTWAMLRGEQRWIAAALMPLQDDR